MSSDSDSPQSTDTLLIHGRAQAGLEEYCRLRGVLYDDVRRQSGLEGFRETASMTGYISLRDHARSLEIASRLAADDCFGLRWTQALGAGPEDTVSLAVRHAPDFRVGVETAARYMRILCDFAEVAVESDHDQVAIAFKMPAALVCRDQMTDRIVSKVQARLSRVGGDRARLVEISVARARPASTAEHERFYRAPVRFVERWSRLVFRVSGDGAPNPLRDDDLFAALCDLNRRRLDDRRRAEDFVAAVSDAISARIAEPDLTVGDVARGLAMSSRGLQRRLSERNLTFHGLHESVRRRMAADLLALTDLPVSEISYRVGFTAVGNFSRAARRWFGCPPREWRQSHGVPAASPRH